jgi:hypothetical protein
MGSINLYNAHVISSEICTGMPDGLLFTAEGYLILGKNNGKKMLSLQGYH